MKLYDLCEEKKFNLKDFHVSARISRRFNARKPRDQRDTEYMQITITGPSAVLARLADNHLSEEYSSDHQIEELLAGLEDWSRDVTPPLDLHNLHDTPLDIEGKHNNTSFIRIAYNWRMFHGNESGAVTHGKALIKRLLQVEKF